MVSGHCCWKQFFLFRARQRQHFSFSFVISRLFDPVYYKRMRLDNNNPKRSRFFVNSYTKTLAHRRILRTNQSTHSNGHTENYAATTYPDSSTVYMHFELSQIQNFINGEFVDPIAGRYLDNIEPATGEPYSKVPDSDGDDVGLAVAAAEKAFRDWAKKAAAER